MLAVEKRGDFLKQLLVHTCVRALVFRGAGPRSLPRGVGRFLNLADPGLCADSRSLQTRVAHFLNAALVLVLELD